MSAEAVAAIPTPQADKHWAARADRAEAERAIELWTEAADQHPDDVRVAVLLTRAHLFLLDAFEAQNRNGELVTAAVRWGENAVSRASPAFADAVKRRVTVENSVHVRAQALGRMRKAEIGALYWYQRALATQTNYGSAFYDADKEIRAALERCVELDPDYHHGAPLRDSGTYFASIPESAGGDLDKSRGFFTQALQSSPDNVRTKLMWAATLSVRRKDRAEAVRLVAEIAATPGDAIPDLVPETRAAKRLAVEFSAVIDELF